MNAEEIYKKYVSPPEPKPKPKENDLVPVDDVRLWDACETHKWVLSPMIMDPNTGFRSRIREYSYTHSEPIPAAFSIKDVRISVDGSEFIPMITIQVQYSINDQWNGIASTQVRHDPLFGGPKINPELIDIAAQRLINDIVTEFKNKWVQDPLKERLNSEFEKLLRAS